jgi:hypothetical protein
MTSFDKNTEAASPDHEIVEIESLGVSLGSKYYEFDEKSRNLVDADDKINNENSKVNPRKVEKKPEAEKTNENKPMFEEQSKNDSKINEKKKPKVVSVDNKVKDDKRKNTNLRVNGEENNLSEKENSKPDTNGLKVQKIKILPIRRMAADA